MTRSRRRKIAREESKADRDSIGMEPVADQMIEIVPVNQFVDRLLDPPALAVERGEPTGAEPLNTRDIDPGAPSIGGRAGAERQELQAGIPGTPAQANRADFLEPAALLARETVQPRPHAG